MNDRSIQDAFTDDADREADDADGADVPPAPESVASEEAAGTPAVPEVEQETGVTEVADDVSAAEDAPAEEPDEAVAAEKGPEADTPGVDEPPAVEILEPQLESEDATEGSDTAPAGGIDADEAEAPEAEPAAEAPLEPVRAATAEVLETPPDAGGLPEPDEERVVEAPPEVAEELEEPAPAAAETSAAEPEPEEPEAVVVPEADEDAAAAGASDAAAVAAAQPAPEEAEEAAPAGPDPFRGPGDWYVVHTYAGYENKVKANLESRIGSMQMQEKIFDVEIPMEDVMEIKGGKKQVVQKKVFPGYLLVKMIYDNDSWYVVRNTPGVTGFVSSGTGTKPTPLSKREVEKILTVPKQEVKPQFRLEFEEGDVVRIISGPFADFNGTVDEINVDQSKLKVLVNIFDRETPVELGFDQVAKV